MELATETFLAVSRAYLTGTHIPARQDARSDLLTRAYGSGTRQKRGSGTAARRQCGPVSGVNTRAR